MIDRAVPPTVYEGDWTPTRRRHWRYDCCACGLSHLVNFRIRRRGRIEIQVFVDRRASVIRRARAKP